MLSSSALSRLLQWAADEAGYLLRLLVWLPVWVGVGAAVAAATLAYQLPHTYTVEVGSGQDQAYVRNFHARMPSAGRTCRWSDLYGYVGFPGVGGSRPFTLTLTLNPGRRAPVQIIINGERFLDRTLDEGWQTVRFRVDDTHPSALASRDTVVELRAPDFRTPDVPGEPKGVKLDSVTLEQDAQGGFITPSYSTLGLFACFVLLVYLLIGRFMRGLSLFEVIKWRALTVAFAVGMLLLSVLAWNHAVFSAIAPHLVVTALSAYFLAALCEALLSGSKVHVNLTSLVWRRLLALAFAGAFVARYGGMALPQSVIIDMPYHMRWLRTLLAGDWQALYFPGGLSTVPPEWGLSLLIPKSPLFYVVVAPLAGLPFDLETLVKWVVCLLDASLVPLAYWLVRRLGFSRGAALAAAYLYAAMPLVFRSFAYGILPTILAQWLAALLLAGVLVASNKGWSVLRWVGLTMLAVLAFLSFPTPAVFLTLILAALPVLWLRAGKKPFQWPVYALIAAAWAVAVWAYYGLYVNAVAASAMSLLAPAPGGGATVRWPGGVPQLLAWTAGYSVTVLPLLPAVVAVVALLVRKAGNPAHRRAFVLVLVWLLIAPLFMVVNYRVDMIGKHLFFVMLPVAVMSGIGVWLMSRRGQWGKVYAGLALVTVGWQALLFWVERLVGASA